MSRTTKHDDDDMDDDDVPPVAGERRGALRRQSDIAEAHAAWLEWIILHRGRFAALAATAGSVVTFLATLLAARIIATDDLNRMKAAGTRRDSAIAAQSNAIVQLSSRVASVENSQRLNRYLLCVVTRQVDPAASRESCQQILAEGAP